MRPPILFLDFVAGIGILAGAERALAFPPPVPPPHLWEAIVLTEAAGESLECKVGVAEVLRNRRWDPRGFVGIRRRDLDRFLKNQPSRVHLQARKALEAALRGSNLTGQATHFENVEDFGLPRWARSMEKTVKLGKLTFFRERNLYRKRLG